MISLAQPLLVGIDGGGTKCKAVITDQSGQVLGTGIAGPANPLRGIENTMSAIESSAQKALEDSQLTDVSLQELVAGIGLAGVNMPSLMTELQNWSHPFQQAYFTTDMHIACLGAHKGKDGAVIICGTGSSAIASVNGEQHLIGGHGFLLGDKGSGAWLGLNGVRLALEATDGVTSPTGLTELLKQHTQSDDLLSVLDTMSHGSPAFFAQLAPLVFEAARQNDGIAISLLQQGADYLQNLADKLLDHRPPGLSMIGGLAQPMMPWLSSAMKNRLTPPGYPPEIGAILFAQQQLAQEKN